MTTLQRSHHCSYHWCCIGQVGEKGFVPFHLLFKPWAMGQRVHVRPKRGGNSGGVFWVDERNWAYLHHWHYMYFWYCLQIISQACQAILQQVLGHDGCGWAAVERVTSINAKQWWKGNPGHKWTSVLHPSLVGSFIFASQIIWEINVFLPFFRQEIGLEKLLKISVSTLPTILHDHRTESYS